MDAFFDKITTLNYNLSKSKQKWLRVEVKCFAIIITVYSFEPYVKQGVIPFQVKKINIWYFINYIKVSHATAPVQCSNITKKHFTELKHLKGNDLLIKLTTVRMLWCTFTVSVYILTRISQAALLFAFRNNNWTFQWYSRQVAPAHTDKLNDDIWLTDFL